MWRTEDGVVHSTALPDPTGPFTVQALSALHALFGSLDAAALQALLEDLVDETIEESAVRPFNAEEEEPFVAGTPTVGLFAAVALTEADLRAALASVDWRWRLDIVMAMEDLADA